MPDEPRVRMESLEQAFVQSDEAREGFNYTNKRLPEEDKTDTRAFAHRLTARQSLTQLSDESNYDVPRGRGVVYGNLKRAGIHGDAQDVLLRYCKEHGLVPLDFTKGGQSSSRTLKEFGKPVGMLLGDIASATYVSTLRGSLTSFLHEVPRAKTSRAVELDHILGEGQVTSIDGLDCRKLRGLREQSESLCFKAVQEASEGNVAALRKASLKYHREFRSDQSHALSFARNATGRIEVRSAGGAQMHPQFEKKALQILLANKAVTHINGRSRQEWQQGYKKDRRATAQKLQASAAAQRVKVQKGRRPSR